jgi:RNA-directed DNA polymerase
MPPGLLRFDRNGQTRAAWSSPHGSCGAAAAQRSAVEPVAISRSQLRSRDRHADPTKLVCNIVGGVCSPVLANIALDGLGAVLQRLKLPSGRGHLHLVRYCDDFVVTAPRRDLLEGALPHISTWLAERGLELHPEKTRIVHIDQGFPFLGFHLRRYKGKLLIKPRKEKVLAKLREWTKWLNGHKAIAADAVIQYLNPRVRNWAAYYQHAVSKRTFDYVDHRLVQILWRWAKRRHPTKGRRWIKERYFQVVGGRHWVFAATTKDRRGRGRLLTLFQVADAPIVRHIKVKGEASPR